MDSMRIGFGNDIHRFDPDRDLFLCGCRIPCHLGGLLGHSDADAPLHAVIDALLGALAAKVLIAIGMPEELFGTCVLLAMCAFMGGTMRAPG